ncbi:hypothetical protein AM493_17190 [Flavobacterium akiainvivens]|uniref:Uncharacterized protein n=1 Tax=Flavobacterium akiainvivens TaxID=1202724 RepID=A0A0M9VK27_9FLAO|nr:hypothetical protein [Flavobacterium akiainvivens]KOS08400.1 hypothetical protein AM493_17190 [Flavobacterium akiainvivens]
MKKIAVFIALFLFLRPILPVGEYVFNYNYIAKELCINKDKPVMHCNGKCHLMKELAKKAAEENPSSEKKTATAQFEILALVQEPFTISFTEQVNYNISPATVYTNLYSHNYNPVFLRPPGLA